MGPDMSKEEAEHLLRTAGRPAEDSEWYPVKRLAGLLTASSSCLRLAFGLGLGACDASRVQVCIVVAAALRFGIGSPK